LSKNENIESCQEKQRENKKQKMFVKKNDSEIKTQSKKYK